MKQLIAKTREGTEYLHSKIFAFFVSANASKITEALNTAKYNLLSGEKWYIYDYDFSQAYYVEKRIYITKTGKIKTATL